MDYASLVQSVGRPGESIYAYSIPNYSPIQAITKIPSGQAGFSGGNGNSQSNLESKTTKPGLPEDYRVQASKIQNDAVINKMSIVPGMLLNLIA
jgi:hypothetical protein